MTTTVNHLEKEVPTLSSVGTSEAAPDGLARPTIPGKLGATSLELPDGLSREDWLELVKMLFKSHTSMQWAIGDALVYGDNVFGQQPTPKSTPDLYQTVAWATGYDVGTLYDIASVSRKVLVSLRNQTLSWSHHRAVRSFDPEKQKYYLNLAVECRLSVTRLRYEIQTQEGTRPWPLDPMTEGERLLLPPPLQPPVGPEKPPPEKPKIPPSFKSLEMKTNMTPLEIRALEQFAKGKKIGTDIAIRALVTLALHQSGHLQQTAEHSEANTIAEAEADREKIYLLYLGQTWFGDENKFPFVIEHTATMNNSDDRMNYTPTKSKASPANGDRYIETIAALLNQIPEMTPDDVQRNIGGIPVSKAASILAEARKLWEARKEEARAEEEAKAQRAKAREEEMARWAKERKEADERRAAEAELMASVTATATEEPVSATEPTATEQVTDPAEFDDMTADLPD
jgi:hypothetical protein